MDMFCYQCQEAAHGTGCDFVGVCGKSADLADLQDLLIYVTKGISNIVVTRQLDVSALGQINHEVLKSLFMTITNANWDEAATIREIFRMIALRDELRGDAITPELHDAAVFEVADERELRYKAAYSGYKVNENIDIRSLRQLIIFGLKGIAAYASHALQLGKEDPQLYAIIYEGLAASINEALTEEELIALTMKTGECGVAAMALLDEANTSRYGNPQSTEVNIGVQKNPAILVTGHDLTDLEQLLEQTRDTGVDVYTHSEMLPAHYYPAFKKYQNFVGNYGGSWWRQLEEFVPFNGPILFTTNCLVPPIDETVQFRIFTTGASGHPNCRHIEADAQGGKDFSEIIALAKTCDPPQEIETGKIVGGFAHDQVFALADQVVEAVQSGAIRKFVVMAGCDGRMESREYYTEFAARLPADTVILTAGCAKYRYNKLDLGAINGIPRVLDAGQCNDSYSLALIALKLKEIFGLEDVNELPIVYNIAWYEQKAVTVLLSLLSLGVKNIHLGPTLPAFLSPNVAKVIMEKFGLTGIGTVDEDLARFMV